MDPNLRSTIQINTFYSFLISVSFAIITQLITMLAVVFGDIAGKEHVVAAPLTVITLTTSCATRLTTTRKSNAGPRTSAELKQGCADFAAAS